MNQGKPRIVQEDAGVCALALRRAAYPPHPPVLLTLDMVTFYFIPTLGVRALQKMISAGEFPKADYTKNFRNHLWRRETVQAWLDLKAPAKGVA